VPGIGEQRDRVGDDAEHRLDGDEAEVEDDADGKGAAEVGRGMAMVVMMEQPGEPAAQARAMAVIVVAMVVTRMVVTGMVVTGLAMRVVVIVAGMIVAGMIVPGVIVPGMGIVVRHRLALPLALAGRHVIVAAHAARSVSGMA
jgi:hypothetical protein